MIDESKLCERVGASFPIPVEVAPVFAQRTVRQIAVLPTLAPCDPRLRFADASSFPPKPFLTDNGNYVVDVYRTCPVDDVSAAAEELKRTSGVIEHGLFVALDKSIVLVGRKDGVSELEGVTVLGA